MGDFPSSSEPSLEQQLLSLERMLKDQHESHQQQLASFMAANASLQEENGSLRNVATNIPRLDDVTTTTHHLDVPTTLRNPAQSESTDNFSTASPPPSPRYARQQRDQIALPLRNVDGTLHALEDMTSSPFIHEPGSPTALHIAEISNVRRSLGPFRPSDALLTNHDASDWQQCLAMQGLPFHLGRSGFVMVPSSNTKHNNVVLSPV